MASLNLKTSRVVLLLQGGGTLGAYQVGAYEALAERCQIDWVGGISIGAINAAVIAGHRDPDAVNGLAALWRDILSPPYPPYDYATLMRSKPPWAARTWLQALEPKYASWMWSAFNHFGQANFFSSRVLNPFQNPWLLQWFRPLERDELAFYGTDPLRRTLDEHVDWNSVHQRGAVRLILGATDVCDGEVVLFDSAELQINADHVLASGALPPAFPPIEIDGHWYFDGGISSNTPIEAMQSKLSDRDARATVVFLVDLWDRKHDLKPRTLDEVLWRQKSIQFGSRKQSAEIVVRDYEYKAKSGKIPPVRLDVCQVMYEHDHRDSQFSFSDADFSVVSFEHLRKQGYEDMTHAIEHPEQVPDVGGQFASLYRFGTLHKHHRTDAGNTDTKRREEQQMLAWRSRQHN